MKYFSAKKRMSPATCNNMDRVLSETRERQISHLYMEPKKLKLTKTEGRMIVARSWGLGKMGKF